MMRKSLQLLLSPCLEAVDDDLGLCADVLVDQEIVDVSPLVARQLDDLTELKIFRHGAVALEVLLEGLADALHVQVFREALDRRDTPKKNIKVVVFIMCILLSSVALLNADMDLRLVTRLLVGVVERIEVFQVLDVVGHGL